MLWSVPSAVAALAFIGAAPTTADIERWSLGQAIAEAQKSNPRALEAVAKSRRVRAELDRINGTFWPQLEAGVRYSISNLPAVTFANLVNQASIGDRGFTGFGDFDDLPTTDNLEVAGGLTLPLYAGGRRFAQKRALRHGVAALDHESHATRAHLGLEVARSYFAVERARALKTAAEAAVVAYTENLEVARNRRDAGQMLEQDVLNVEVRLSEAQEAVLTAGNAAELGLRSLNALLALDSAAIDIEPTTGLTVPPDDQAPERAELRACRQASRRADAMVDAAWSGYLPNVGAFGRLIYNQGFAETDGNSFSFIAGVGIDLRFGLDTQGAIDAARQQRAATEHQCEQLVLAFRLQVEQAQIRLADATARLQVVANEIEFARQSAELVRDRFHEGLSLSTQLIEAETALTAARVRRVDATASRQTAIAELRHALGLPIIESTSN